MKNSKQSLELKLNKCKIKLVPYDQAILFIEAMRYISIPIYYENKEMKYDPHVIDTKHCKFLNGDTILLFNILQLPEEKLQVSNVLNESNNIKHIRQKCYSSSTTKVSYSFRIA